MTNTASPATEARNDAWRDALAATVTREEAGHKILEARGAGYSWEFIAQALQCHPSTARAWARTARLA